MHLKLNPQIEPGDWDEYAPVLDGEIVAIGGRGKATGNGKTAVGIVVRLADGSHVGAWTTHALLNAANAGIIGRHGMPE